MYMKAFGRAESTFSQPTTVSWAAAQKLRVLTLNSVASFAAGIPDRMSSGSGAKVAAQAIREKKVSLELWAVPSGWMDGWVTIVNYNIRETSKLFLNLSKHFWYVLWVREIRFEWVKSDLFGNCQVRVARGRGNFVPFSYEFFGNRLAKIWAGSENKGDETHFERMLMGRVEFFLEASDI